LCSLFIWKSMEIHVGTGIDTKMLLLWQHYIWFLRAECKCLICIQSQSLYRTCSFLLAKILWGCCSQSWKPETAQFVFIETRLPTVPSRMVVLTHAATSKGQKERWLMDFSICQTARSQFCWPAVRNYNSVRLSQRLWSNTAVGRTAALNLKAFSHHCVLQLEARPRSSVDSNISKAVLGLLPDLLQSCIFQRGTGSYFLC